MTETKIVDGTGHGYRVGVSEEFRLLVETKSRTSEEVEAIRNNAYIFHGECHLAAGVSGGLMTFENTSNETDIIITRIYIDPHTLTLADLIVTQWKSPTISGGTDISTTGIVQKNFEGPDSLTGTLKISDGSSDITLSGGTKYHSFPVKSMTSLIREMRGTNVITPNTSIAWGWKRVSGGNAVDAEIISLSVNCFKRARP